MNLRGRVLTGSSSRAIDSPPMHERILDRVSGWGHARRSHPEPARADAVEVGVEHDREIVFAHLPAGLPRVRAAVPGLRSLGEPWADTTSPAGKTVLTVF